MHTNLITSAYIRALALLLVAFVAGNALAAFIEPTSPATGGNVLAPLNTGATAQVKEGNFGANRITTTGRLCFGPTACISGWWDSTPSSCRLEVKKVNSNSSSFDIASPGTTDKSCNSYLTAASKAAGWVATGSDYCGSIWDRDCQRPYTCIYMRMKCTGIVTELPTTSPIPGYETHPVPGFTQ